MERPSYALPRCERVRKRGDFLRVQRQGRSAAHPLLVLAARPNRLGTRRLGLTVSTKVGNSVVRSRVKRWLREIYRHEKAALPEAIDLVIIARRGAGESSLEALREAFLQTAGRLGRRRR